MPKPFPKEFREDVVRVAARHMRAAVGCGPMSTGRPEDVATGETARQPEHTPSRLGTLRLRPVDKVDQGGKHVMT